MENEKRGKNLLQRKTQKKVCKINEKSKGRRPQTRHPKKKSACGRELKKKTGWHV